MSATAISVVLNTGPTPPILILLICHTDERHDTCLLVWSSLSSLLQGKERKRGYFKCAFIKDVPELRGKRGQLGKTRAWTVSAPWCCCRQPFWPLSWDSALHKIYTPNLLPKFNFYTSKHKSLILKYKEAKIKVFLHWRKKKLERKKRFES